MVIVPTKALPNQTLQIQLGTQACQIVLFQTSYGIFINLYVSGVLIIGGVRCENLNRIVRSLYLGFSGDLVFYDTQGTDDPIYTGVGTRFLLVYLTAEELAGAG